VELLPAELRASLPTFQDVREEENPMVHVKFFLPFTQWTWYAVAFDGVDTFIGWVIGDFAEVGSFALSELEGLDGPFGVKVARDLAFTPQQLSVVQAQERANGRGLY